MIHLVTAANASLYVRQLDQMHRMRWRFYVEHRGWRALREMQTTPGIERDQYDDRRAHYLLALDSCGDVQGSLRVRPANDRSLLLDKFPALLEEDPATILHGDVWEMTRLNRAPMSRAADGAVRAASVCGLIEFSLSRGVRRLVCSVDTFLVPAIRKTYVHKSRPLGLPQDYEEGEHIAMELAPDAEMLDIARDASGIVTPQFFEHPCPWQASGHDPIGHAAMIERMRMVPQCASHAHA